MSLIYFNFICSNTSVQTEGASELCIRATCKYLEEKAEMLIFVNPNDFSVLQK